MKTTIWLSAIAALAMSCTSQGHDTGTEQPGSRPPPGDNKGCGSDGGVMCPPIGAPGTIVDTFSITGGQIVAVDGGANIFYTANAGIVKLDPRGNRVYAFPFGSVLAVDREGNAYVGGSFTAPISIDSVTLVPSGNIDVFVIKLDPAGHIVFAEALGLCGDGALSIAVDLRGRIAVSGDAMGTALLDAFGKLQLVLPYFGQVAFDTHQNLYVAGSFTGSIDFGGGHVLDAASPTDVDAFVVKVDMSGNALATLQLGDAPLPITGQDNVVITEPQPQIITNIAVNDLDQIAILGTFPQEMDLFGQILVFTGTFPSGTTLGPFVAELDSSLGEIFSTPLDRFYARNPVGSVAIDDASNVVISHNVTSEAFAPFALPVLTKLDMRGSIVWQLGPEFSVARGFGLGVATDLCGNAYWADSEHDSPLELLQQKLRVVAR
jgi:hypothetical protein